MAVVGKKIKLLQRIQEDLWYDLGHALRESHNGYWSIKAEAIVDRIIEVGRVVGFTPWGRVNMPLVYSGVYGAVLGKAGQHFVMPDLPPEHAIHAKYPMGWSLTVEKIQEMELER